MSGKYWNADRPWRLSSEYAGERALEEKMLKCIFLHLGFEAHDVFFWHEDILWRGIYYVMVEEDRAKFSMLSGRPLKVEEVDGMLREWDFHDFNQTILVEQSMK